MLVLRTIRRAEEAAFVPHLSVTLGVLLAVASVGVLIYFVHHVSVAIQANEVAARISKERIERIDRLFPDHIGRGAPMIPAEPPDVGIFEAFDKDARSVVADRDGYLQFVDGEALLALAMEEDLEKEDPIPLDTERPAPCTLLGVRLSGTPPVRLSGTDR